MMNKILSDLSYKDFEILNIIHKKGPITKKDLQYTADIKLTTLNRIMKNLYEKNLIVEIGKSESTGGRKAAEYEVVSNGFYVIGIDLSRTYVKIIITNLKIEVLMEEQFTMRDSFSPEKTVEKISELIEAMLLRLSINKNQVLGIGVGTIGPMDREKGILLNPKNFFNHDWVNVSLKSMLESKISITCFIDNGANTAVLAENLFGKGKNLKSVVYIHCGVGIRTAIINDEIIIRTMNDTEDAFAHMIVDVNGEKCVCGNNGCVESYSSMDAIVKKYSYQINSEKSVNGNLQIKEENYKAILELALKKDKAVMAILDKGAEIFGVGLANLVRLLNPQLVILSGPLIMNYSPYYDMCIEAFHKNNCLNNEVIFSKGGMFKENVIAVGASLMVIEYYLRHLQKNKSIMK